jgi:FkbM family methyltransferase
MTRLVDQHARLSYAQEGEDMILLRLFAGQRSGFYVDVGAHHPFRFSNTCSLHQLGWRGINIDADATLLAAFKRHRPADINLAMGVSDQPGTMTLNVFDEPALNTFDESVAREKAKDGTYKVVARVPVCLQSLDAILAAHLPTNQRIDLLTIDAEGFDLKVLQSNDWKRFRPRAVVVEIFSKTLSDAMASPAHALLDRESYDLYAKTGNSMVYVDARQSFP